MAHEALLRWGARMAPLLAAWCIVGANQSSAISCTGVSDCTLYVRLDFAPDGVRCTLLVPVREPHAFRIRAERTPQQE